MALGDQVVHILKSYVLKSVTIGFAILLIVLVIWLVHGSVTGIYWNAKRARSAGNIELATQLFAEAVKEDTRSSSGNALLALTEMDEPQSLEHLVGLSNIFSVNYFFF